MTCKCGTDHDAAGPDLTLRAGEDHLGSLPKGGTYLSRGGLRIFVYTPSGAPKKCRRKGCSCPTPEDRQECPCVPVRIESDLGTSYMLLPFEYPVRSLEA